MSKNDGIEMPKWFQQLESAAGRFVGGCVSAEIVIFIGAKYILKPSVIEVMHMIIVPFGTLCLILSGFKGLDGINKYYDAYKKIKKDAE